MTKKERAQFVQKRLNELYPMPGIPLRRRNPFKLLIAVILSAQCTDKRVNATAPVLFRAASTPRAMACLPVEKIEAVIRPCGLAPTKSKAISRLSRILVNEHAGKVPADWEALEGLPGVGHKTASVVMAQAFGQPAFPVDTHIHRLARRWGLSPGKNVRRTEADLKKLFPQEIWHGLHLQIICYGREYCTARGCDGTVCEICRALYPKRKSPQGRRKS